MSSPNTLLTPSQRIELYETLCEVVTYCGVPTSFDAYTYQLDDIAFASLGCHLQQRLTSLVVPDAPFSFAASIPQPELFESASSLEEASIDCNMPCITFTRHEKTDAFGPSIIGREVDLSYVFTSGDTARQEVACVERAFTIMHDSIATRSSISTAPVGNPDYILRMAQEADASEHINIRLQSHLGMTNVTTGEAGDLTRLLRSLT